MLGIGAIVGVYELLTAGSKKTQEESDKLTKSINDQASAADALTEAGRRLTAQQADAAAKLAASPAGAGFMSMLLQGMAPGGQSINALSSGDADRVAATRKAAQNALNALGTKIGEDNTKEAAERKRIADEADAALQKRIDLLTKGIQFENTRAKVTSELIGIEHGLETQVNDGNLALEKRIVAATRLGQVMDALGQKFTGSSTTRNTALGALIGITGNGQTAVSRAFDAFGGPMSDVKFTGANGIITQPGQADLIGAKQTADMKLLENADRNAKQTRDAIWGAAMQGASIIVNALNLGGGGPGSSLGGALGSTAGSIIGQLLGSGGGTLGALGGPVGSMLLGTAGTIMGSLIGGLFDHKSAVDRNTIALNNLSASLTGAPGGFKVQGYNYAASDAKAYRAMTQAGRRLAARGGRNGFQLQGT